MSASPTPAPASTSPAPDSRRAHRSLTTWAAGTAAGAIVSLAGFFATPWLVHWLGDPAFGAWEVVGEWLGYLGLTQLALGPGALMVFLLRAHTEGETGALTAVARRGLRLYLLTALALTPAALLLAWMAPVWMHASPRLAAGLRGAVAIAALGSLALAPFAIFRGVLEVVQRGYLVRLAILIQSLLITGLSLLLCWLRWGIAGMAAATIAGMALGAALWWFWARRWLPHWRATPPADLRAREIWSVNWPLLLATLGNQINQMTDNTVVALRLGPAAVAGFVLTQALPQLAGQHWTDVGATSWAPLGELRVKDPPGFAKRVIELGGTILGAGIALLATLAVFNRAFVLLWVGPRHYDGALLTWATAASTMVFSHICFYSWITDTQGATRRRLLVSSIGSALNLGLSLALVRPLGVAGVALGTLIADSCTDAWYLPRLIARQYGVPGRALARSLLSAGLRGGIWAAAMLALSHWLPLPLSWWTLLGQLLLLGAAALAWCWWVVLRAQDRTEWMGRLRALRPAVRG